MERSAFVNTVANKMRNNMCDLFIGSGISAPSGLPTWSSFLKEHLSEIGIEIAEGDNLPLLAQYIQNSNAGNRRIIDEAVYNTFGQEYHPNSYHSVISKFPVKTIWTTNYDNLLEQAFLDQKTRIIFSEDALLHPHSDYEIEIVKLHGCAKAASQGIVLTRQDYDSFSVEKPKLSHHLRESMINKSILFLGYSYQDPNIHAIMTQAYQMMGKMTKAHYIILNEIKKRDGECGASFDQREKRFKLWISELNRIGIRELVIPQEELVSVLGEIDKEAHDACVFVTGSHSVDAETKALANLIGKTLAENSKVVLNSGQSSGVGSEVLSSFMQHVLEAQQDFNKRVHIFPNPYAISPEYSNDPTLIPHLKSARVPLVTSSRFIIAFPGNMGTVAEIEVARAKDRIVLPVILSQEHYESPAIKYILADTHNMDLIKEVSKDYYNILIKSSIPTDKNTIDVIRRLINE